MRYVLLLCAVLCGCEYETNYYGGSDAGCGAVDMGYHDEFGDYHEDASLGIFKPESKLQGHENLVMDAPPLALLDVETVGNVPQLISISMGNSGILNQTLGAIPASEVVAILELGLGGGLFTAEIDMIRGQQLSLVASRLRVNMQFRRINGAAALPVPAPTWEVGASVAQGVIAHGLPPQRTMGTENALAAGVGVAWPIPAFATRFKVSALPDNSQLNITVLRVGAAAIQNTPVVAYPTAWIMLPSDAWAVQINNAGLVPVTGHRVVFELSI
jgi:hypothetical protein